MDHFIVITTTKDSKGKLCISLCNELEKMIPYSQYIACDDELPNHTVKIKVVEHNETPRYIRITDEFGEIEFKIINYKSKQQMNNRGIITDDIPQLVIENFKTELGTQVAGWLEKLFPIKVEGRQVATFVCCNDFIHFRFYRYIFKENKVDFQDIGPHVTMLLKKIMKKDGEIVYEYKKFNKKLRVL